MPRAKKKIVSPEDTLRLENEALQNKIDELEKINASQPVVDDSTNKYMNEIKTIQQTGRVESNTIKVQDFTDHKNISLWTKLGKRIGPLHPHNAKRCFERFWGRGVQLTATRPTQEQIEAYKQTPEYKKEMAAYQRKREIKNQSRKKGTMEKYLKQIAEQTGQSAEQLNRVLQPQEMGSLTQGQTESGVV